MQFKRHFTNDREDVYSDIKFQYTTSEIKNMDGSVVFKAENVETPNFWSQVATDILAQKYFRKAGIAKYLKSVPEEDVPKLSLDDATQDELQIKTLSYTSKLLETLDCICVFCRVSG